MGTHWNIPLYFLYQVLTLEGATHGLYVLWLVVEKGQSPAVVAFLLALGDAALTLCQLPAGLFADRFGRRLSLALGSTAQLAGVVGLWLAQTPLLLMLACLAIGVGDAFRDGADEALLHDSLEQLGRAEEFGRTVARAQQWAQFVLVLFVLGGGWLATSFGFAWVWAAEVLLAGLGLLVVLCLVEGDPAPPEQRVSLPNLREACPPFRFLFPTMALVLMACSTSFGVEASWDGEAFPLTVLVAFTMLFEGLGAGLSAHQKTSLKFSLNLARLCLLAILLAACTSLTWLWVCVVAVSFLTSFCEGVAKPVRAAQIQDWAPAPLRATAASAAYTCDMLFQTVGLCLFGWLLQISGLASACLGVALLVLPLVLVRWSRRPKEFKRVQKIT